MQAVLASQLAKRINDPDIIEQIRHSASIVRGLPPMQREAAVLSYQSALRAVFVANLAVSALTLLCSLPIKEYPLPDSIKPDDAKDSRED